MRQFATFAIAAAAIFAAAPAAADPATSRPYGCSAKYADEAGD